MAYPLLTRLNKPLHRRQEDEPAGVLSPCKLTRRASAPHIGVQTRTPYTHEVLSGDGRRRKDGRESPVTDKLDDLAVELQNQILKETRETYGQVAFERWLNPLYMGVMDNPDGHGRLTGSCGDTMEIFLKVEREKVAEATFLTDGCGPSAVCGSFAVELALGKSLDEVSAITGDTILEVLGGLPQEEQHCAFLAAETLQKALDQYMKKEREGGNRL
jgi:nitrogen fixation protein NifU and related proteins